MFAMWTAREMRVQEQRVVSKERTVVYLCSCFSGVNRLVGKGSIFSEGRVSTRKMTNECSISSPAVPPFKKSCIL